MTNDVPVCSRPLPIDLGAKTPEAQRVIVVGADVPSIREPRGPLEAPAADVPMRPEQTAESGA